MCGFPVVLASIICKNSGLLRWHCFCIIFKLNKYSNTDILPGAPENLLLPDGKSLMTSAICLFDSRVGTAENDEGGSTV
jgi:hypothetical protein